MGLDLLRGDGFERGGGDGVWRLDWIGGVVSE